MSILFNSKQTNEAGGAFKPKYDHLIILLFFDALFHTNKWDISNRTQDNCLSQDTNYFFLSHLWTNLWREN